MAGTCRKEVLTTGDVARICHVAPRTVSKWFDTGKLRGYRIPGSRDRRIPLEHLVAFMEAHGIPLNGLDGSVCRVLIVTEEPDGPGAEALRRTGRYDVEAAADGFEAGVAIEQFRPHVVVVAVEDLSEGAAICRHLRSRAEFRETRTIVAVGSAEAEASLAAHGGCWDAVIGKPIRAEELAAAVGSAAEAVP